MDAVSLRLHGDALGRVGALDYAVNVWPHRPSWLDAALADTLRETSYPDEGPARRSIGARFGRPVAEVLPANGACEVFWLLAAAVRPRLAACVHPSFTEPEAAFRAFGAEVVRVQRERGSWSFDSDAVPDEADVVVLGNPNNPTGTLDATVDLLRLLRPGRLVVVDESFMEFVPGEQHSLAQHGAPGLVVVRSLTKLWSVPGLRAGYALAEAEIVELLESFRQPWSVNALACRALDLCARDTETAPAVSAAVGEARESLVVNLERLGLTVWPSVANFLLVHGPRSLADALVEHGVVVRPCASFPGLDETYVRVAVRGGTDDRQLVAACEAALV